MIRTTLPTRPSTRLLLVPATVLLAAALTACADDPASGGTETPGTETSGSQTSVSPEVSPESGVPALSVEDPWVRATTGSEDPTMSAAFMTLDNEGGDELRVVSASADVAGMVQLHEMAMVEGASVMREIPDGIVLAPGRGQLLQPGGMHVMLMDLKTELVAGDEVELTLELADGSLVEVSAPVKEFTEEEGHYHAPGTDEDHAH
jgi:periplasmic copper chaperone A